jgi:hypothetical protein
MNWCASWKDSVVCGLQCHSSTRGVIPTEHKISAFLTQLYKYNALHEDWILLDTDKDVD